MIRVDSGMFHERLIFMCCGNLQPEAREIARRRSPRAIHPDSRQCLPFFVQGWECIGNYPSNGRCVLTVYKFNTLLVYKKRMLDVAYNKCRESFNDFIPGLTWVKNPGKMQYWDNKLCGNTLASEDKSEKTVQLPKSGMISFDGKTLIPLSRSSCHLESTGGNTLALCSSL